MTLFRLSLGCLILLALSCTKKNVPGPAGPQGPAGANGVNDLTGRLQGKVQLYDTSGTLLADNSGALVSLENTSPQVKITTGTDGSFAFDSLNNGVYSLSIQKQGFGTMRFFNIINTGGQSPSRAGTLLLTQQMPSSFDLKSLRIDSSNKPNLNFIAILAHPRLLSHASLVIYFSDSTGVGPTHNKSSLNFGWYQLNDSTATSGPFSIQLAQFLPSLTKANNIYLSAAIDNWYGTGYRDEQGNFISPSVAKPAPEVILNNSQHIY
jgi:hypothetical protein